MRQLSKSKILAFRQCPKRMWLEIHRPELREDSAATQASFQVGHQVGDIARRIYDPEKQGALIHIESEGFEGAFARSAELLAKSNTPVFEAGFSIPGALAFADVMLPAKIGKKTAWRMVEVKSSTSLKDYHRADIAFQAFVAKASGVNLKSVALAHIDSSWVYPGGGDYQGLLLENDLSEEAFSREAEVREWLAEAQKVAVKNCEPKQAVGDQCTDPFECPFSNYCYRDISQPDYPLEWLPRLSSQKREQLLGAGWDDLRKVPDSELNATQRKVKEHTLANKVFFEQAGAAKDLAPYGFPAYFLDFETVQLPVPIWKGTRPYQQMVFQFSLHKLTKTGKLSHTSFLDISGNDPSEKLAKALIEECGDTGPVYVYNGRFEMSRICELAERFPKMAKALKAINERVVDLLPISRNRYYHPSQHGSWSLKQVLPAAVPELSYASLDGVQDGGMAMEAYKEAIHPDTSGERKTAIEHQLITYCRLDTFAMVRLWQVFGGRKPVTDGSISKELP